MKIVKVGNPKVIMENPYTRYNYFGWPSCAMLQDGKIAVVASGYRLRHICPFGKTVISYSFDGGESYTLPAPVIDTPLDDRDGGIMTFDKRGVIVTSFNNTVDTQRGILQNWKSGTWLSSYSIENGPLSNYAHSYLNTVTKEEEQAYLGSTFRISHDCGITFGKIHKSPVTCPHGPTELKDGSVLWVGKPFDEGDDQLIKAYKVNTENGNMEYVGKIDEPTLDDGSHPLYCEPHTIALDDGSLITHIRVQALHDNGYAFYTLYQSKSYDNGKTFTVPKQIISDMGGAPAHILKHSSGAIISTYGHREMPFGIRAIISLDNGETWSEEHTIYENEVTEDMGYPSTLELNDGSLLTVFYAHKNELSPAEIIQQKWKFE